MLKIGALSLALRVLGLLASFLMGVVLARSLGPADYGIYGLVTTLVALAMTAGVLGTPHLAVRDLSIFTASGDRVAISATVNRFQRATTIASFAIAAVIAGGGWWLTKDQPTLRALILPAALLVPLTAWTSLIAAELRGLGQMMKGQWMDIFVRPALAFILIAAWVMAGMGLTTSKALWIQVAATTLTALVSWIWIRQAAPSGFGSTAAVDGKPWLSAALFLMAVDFIRTLGGTYGVVMMGWLENDVALGMFRVAFACNIVVALPVTILHVILAPNVAQLHKENRKPELQRMLSLTSLAMVAMVTPIAIAAYFLGRQAIELVFGPEYAPAWLALFYICVAQLVYGLFGMAPVLLAMCEREKQLFSIFFVSTLAGVIAAYPLIIWRSAAGAAVAMMISNALTGLLAWYVGWKDFGVDSTPISLFRRSRPAGTNST